MKHARLLAILAAGLIASAPAASADTVAGFEQRAYDAGRSLRTATLMDAAYTNPEAVSQIMDIARLETVSQKVPGGGLYSMELFLNGESALSLSTISKNGAYRLLGSLLGDDVLAFSPAELGTFLARLMSAAVPDESIQGSEKDEYDRAIDRHMDKQMEDAFAKAAVILASGTSFSQMLIGEYAFSGIDPKIPQEKLNKLMEELLASLLANPKREEGAFTGDGHDPASVRLTHAISYKQLRGFAEIWSGYLLTDEVFDANYGSLVAALIQQGLGDVPVEKLMALVPSFLPYPPEAFLGTDANAWLKDLRGLFSSYPALLDKEVGSRMTGPLTFTRLLDENGNPVLESLQVTLDPASPGGEPLDIFFSLGTKTGGDGPQTRLLASAREGETVYMDVDFLSTETLPVTKEGTTASGFKWSLMADIRLSGENNMRFALGHTSSALSGDWASSETWETSFRDISQDYGPEIILSGSAKAVFDGRDVRTIRSVDMAFGQPGGMPSGRTAGIPFLNIMSTTTSGDPVALPEAASGNPLYPGAMTQEEFDAWLQAAYVKVLARFMGLVKYLPPAILHDLIPL